MLKFQKQSEIFRLSGNSNQCFKLVGTSRYLLAFQIYMYFFSIKISTLRVLMFSNNMLNIQESQSVITNHEMLAAQAFLLISYFNQFCSLSTHPALQVKNSMSSALYLLVALNQALKSAHFLQATFFFFTQLIAQNTIFTGLGSSACY